MKSKRRRRKRREEQKGGRKRECREKEEERWRRRGGEERGRDPPNTHMELTELGGLRVSDDIITLQITDTQNLYSCLVEEIPILVDTGGIAARNPFCKRAANQLTRTTFDAKHR